LLPTSTLLSDNSEIHRDMSALMISASSGAHARPAPSEKYKVQQESSESLTADLDMNYVNRTSTR
jgi:hypothetical protein